MRKKLLLVVIFLLIGNLPVSAQRIWQAWDQTATQEMPVFATDKFSKNFFSAYAPSFRTPWQAALFLGEELRPTEETLQTIQKQMEQGYLQTASVLSFAPEKDGTAHLYILSTYQGQVSLTEKIFAADTPLPTLLEALFQPLQANGYYTALLVNARGDGSLMRYANERILVISKLISSIQTARIYIDVLDLQACHMGSAFIVNKLAQSKKIHYAIVSSELRRGSHKFPYYSLLNHFDKNPLEAALAAHQELPQVIDMTHDHVTHNSLVLDMLPLQQLFTSWLQSTNRKTVLPPGWHSFTSLLHQQNTPAAQQLAAALEQATLSQWCFSAHTHTLYQNEIPAESGCIKGLNINPETLYNVLNN